MEVEYDGKSEAESLDLKEGSQVHLNGAPFH
jgi:hypothetical protein